MSYVYIDEWSIDPESLISLRYINKRESLGCSNYPKCKNTLLYYNFQMQKVNRN